MKAKGQTATNPIITAELEAKNLTAVIRCLIYLPPGYGESPDKKWPLMLFLHGSGERGTDVQRVAVHGPLSHVKQGTNFPFIIVAPLCAAGERWENEPLIRLLDHVQTKYAVDADRVYLTGMSMGGYGTWQLGLKHPERFAALAPICGGVSLIDTYMARRERGDAIKRLPIWAFHGEQDPIFSPEESARAISELKQHGLKKLKLTIYPETKHDSWKQAYADPTFYEWLLEQSL